MLRYKIRVDVVRGLSDNIDIHYDEQIFRYLAEDGRHPYKQETMVSNVQARRINSLMMTCGTYDEAGEFACPAKVV